MNAQASNPNASPLSWPITQPRAKHRVQNWLWRQATVATASVQIEREVERLGGKDLILSTNLALRADGFPRSGQPMPSDPGVAVYFVRKGRKLVFPCDRYTRVEWNLRAIAMHLEAMRGQERWGVGTLDQAFAGYQALPETAGGDPWWKVLGVADAPTSVDDLKVIYRDAAKAAHPDGGGSSEAFQRVHAAYRQGLEAIGGAA